MINPAGHHVGWRHNHAHAEPRRIKKPFGKIIGHADATMRGRVPMQRDARPSEALHVGHVGIIIHVGVMLGLLLKDAEDSSWCLTSLLPTRYWSAHDPPIDVIYGDLLVAQRNDRHDWLTG